MNDKEYGMRGKVYTRAVTVDFPDYPADIPETKRYKFTNAAGYSFEVRPKKEREVENEPESKLKTALKQEAFSIRLETIIIALLGLLFFAVFMVVVGL